MLTIIHGDDIVASRKILYEEKEKEADAEIIRIDGSKLTLADLASSSETISLFGIKRIIIIENLLAGTLTKQKESLLSYLGKSQFPDHIVWESQEISKALLHKYFSKAKIIACQPPALIFKFLDSIGARPASYLLSLFRQVLVQADPEFIFVMILRQWRYLLIAKDLGQKGMMSLLSPWQSRKFVEQARYFTLGQLTVSYRNLLSMEYRIKTGKIPYSLAELIDIFLISI